MSRAAEHLFAVACPSCRATVAVDRGLVGEAARCPVCPADFIVPDPGPAAPTERSRPPSPGVADEPRDQDVAPVVSRDTAAAPETTPTRLEPGVDERLGRAPQEEAAPRHVGADVGNPSGRRLKPDERARRRSRRTLVIMIGGITILLVLAATLGRRPRRSRR